MRVRVAPSKRATASMLEQLKEGWSYVTGFRPIRTILTLFAVMSLMGMPFVVLMPIFASQVLHGGPHTLGYLMGASGVGALVSAISLTLRKSVRGLTTMIQISAALFGTGLILFGLSRNLALSLLLMLVVGFGMMQGLAASNTVIQTLVPEDKRGRVMSYYTVAFVGMAPFGSLLAGALAHRFGAPHAVMITGACCVAGSVWFTTQLPAVRAIMRPIYVEMGILPSPEQTAMEDRAACQ
jgi:MFS family permease